jgi:predicted unusual protein kinase regulating ubiquinone biosynthesis (AarF/ABC1/UbiB family)
MLLMLLAFWRRDAKFLSDVVLMLSGEEQRSDLDVRALEADVAGFVDRFLPASLQEIQLGPMLDALVEIATRHGVRLPASLALSGKAFGQMQLAVTELDPELDPFAVISGFLLRGLSGRLREHANPQRMYYDAQKLKLRVGRMFEAIERAIGARPGRKLQIEFIGASPIEQAIRRAGRRLALAMTAAATFIAVGLTAASSHASGWIPSVLGAVAGVFAVALAYDLVRRR